MLVSGGRCLKTVRLPGYGTATSRCRMQVTLSIINFQPVFFLILQTSPHPNYAQECAALIRKNEFKKRRSWFLLGWVGLGLTAARMMHCTPSEDCSLDSNQRKEECAVFLSPKIYGWNRLKNGAAWFWLGQSEYQGLEMSRQDNSMYVEKFWFMFSARNGMINTWNLKSVFRPVQFRVSPSWSWSVNAIS